MTQPIPQPKASVAALRRYSPGASYRGAVKLSSNESPFVPPRFVRRAVWKALRRGNRYPSSAPSRLVAMLAARERVAEQQVVLGNGSDELMQLLCSAYVGEGDCGVVPHYTFSVYTHALSTVAATVIPISMPHYRLEYAAVSDAVKRSGERCRMVFITTPNSPTGDVLDLDELQRIIDVVPPTALLVIDYAYVDFIPERHYLLPHEVFSQHPNVVFLKTMSKLYGLAGLRIGYALANSEVAQVLNTVRLPFSVNECAASAAIVALKHPSFYRKVVHTITVQRNWLQSQLQRLGYGYMPSQANFVMVGPLRSLSSDRHGSDGSTYSDGTASVASVVGATDATGAEDVEGTVVADGTAGEVGVAKTASTDGILGVADTTNDTHAISSPAQQLYHYLKRCGYVVRPLDSFGLSQYVRISIGLPRHNRGIIRALEKLGPHR